MERRVREAARRYGAGYGAIVAHLAAVYRRTEIRPAEALSIGLADPNLPEEAVAACIGKLPLLRLQARLNPGTLACLTEDKSVFYPFAEGLGVPVPRTLAVAGRGGGWIRGGAPVSGREAWARFFSESLPEEFISKPAEGVYGDGFVVWRRVGGAFVDHAGRPFSAAALHDSFCADARYDRFVLQERLRSHPEIARLSGSPFLQTVRLTTLVDGRGDAHVLHAHFKIIVGDNVTDNFQHGRSGNLVASVALESGALRLPLRMTSEDVGPVTTENHPATGVRMPGFTLPWWSEAMSLVRRAALLFLPVRTIGWDVALTPDGPMIVEGNRTWDFFNLCPGSAAFPDEALRETLSKLNLLRSEAASARPGRR